MKKETFPVTGMTCAACAVSVESMLRSTKGVSDAAVNFASQTATVTFDPETATEEAMRASVQAIGYDLLTGQDRNADVQEEQRAAHVKELRNRTIWASLLSIPVVIIGMFFMDMPGGNWISLLLTAPVVFWFGRSFFVHAWKQARHRKANMDTLVALSSGIAFLFSTFNTLFPEYWHSRGLHAHVYFEAASVIIAFISLGKWLEERAKSSTSEAIRKMMGLQARTVRIAENGEEKEIAIEEVRVGQTIVVRPGEKIAVDGTVSAGSSYVDESTITGEPVPALKTEGEKVWAGTVNQKGSFRFTAEKVGSETVLAQIIRTVQQAQDSKAPVQHLVDRIAGIFVPVVIVIALLTFTTWMIFGGENAFTHALLTSVSVLVIACPCALGLATPTAIMVGVGKGAENNILIKDAESLEVAHRVQVVVLDKTGTITEGRPIVTNEEWYTQDPLDRAVLYTLEVQSEHPLAAAVVNHLQSKGIQSTRITDFTSITARGVKATAAGKTYFVGNIDLMRENRIPVSEAAAEQAHSWQRNARTVIYFASDTALIAVLAIADAIKPTSAEAIRTLQDRGIDVIMLTGDNHETAEAVAREAGIREFRAGMLPSQKAAVIRGLQQEGKVVAMVGDGINDSEALAQSDVSIAMGKGSDIAMDVARMTLITSDLRSVPRALQLSRKTVMGIRQNLFWAFIYNLIGIPLAAGILYPFNGFLLDPMIAGGAMALSSVSVVANSLRLRSVSL